MRHCGRGWLRDTHTRLVRPRSAWPRLGLAGSILLGGSILLAGVVAPSVSRAETVSWASIGCDDLTATLMAEEALRDKLSGKDHNAMERINAYRKQAGQDACRPMSQGDKVRIVRSQDDMVCVQEQDERMLGPEAPECYWMRRRHIKLPGN